MTGCEHKAIMHDEDGPVCYTCGVRLREISMTCEDCNGHGVVTVDAQVYPGEPHMAPIDETTCLPCGGSGAVETYQEDES